MTKKTSSPQHTGSRIELDGRAGTLLAFAVWDWRRVLVPGAWRVVFDDAPEQSATIEADDTDRVVDVTPKLRDDTYRGQKAYLLDMPNGTYTIFKRGAYWYTLPPGHFDDPKNFSGINTRISALTMALHHYAQSVAPSKS